MICDQSTSSIIKVQKLRCQRDVAVVPGLSTKHAAMIAASCLCVVFLSTISVAEEAMGEYLSLEQVMSEVRGAASERRRILPRTLVFSQSQLMYWHDRNYLHEWVDRPLFSDRSRGMEATLAMMVEKTRLMYDIDGLGFFPQNFRRMRFFDLIEEAVITTGIADFKLIPQFFHRKSEGDLRKFGHDDPKATVSEDELDYYSQVVERALSSPLTPRTPDGRVVIVGYNDDLWTTPDKLGRILTALRSRHGNTFVYLPGLAGEGGVFLRNPYRRGEVKGSDIVELQAKLRRWLDAADGIYFFYAPSLRDDSSFPFGFHREFYEEVMIPVWQSVLNEPEYQSKYLGLNAFRAHANLGRANSMQENGTRTFRDSFEASMLADPDIIMLPEWCEQNENTSFRPTTYNSMALGRILRYYMSVIRGIEPSPMPGDDTAVPNLILSARKMASLGEQAVFEILNVPDGQEDIEYEIRFSILDQDGSVLEKFPSEVVNALELREIRYLIATEEYPDAVALIPYLEVVGYKSKDITFGEGLPFTKVRGTWNWNHLYVKQPLRDLLVPESFSFTLGRCGDSEKCYNVSGNIVASEQLASVEIVEFDNEVYAVDPYDEFSRNNPNRTLLLVDFQDIDIRPFEVSVNIEGAKAVELFTELIYPEPKVEKHQYGIKMDFSTTLHHRRMQIYLAIDDNRNPDVVSIYFDVNGGGFVLPLSEILDKGVYCHASPDGLRITLTHYRKQYHHPMSLQENEASFRTSVWPRTQDASFHVRAITQSGKTFRSWPRSIAGSQDVLKHQWLELEGIFGKGGSSQDSGELADIRVYSQKLGKGVDLRVGRERVPEANYLFKPSDSAVLYSDSGVFQGTLGGFMDSTSGRGTPSANHRREYDHPITPVWVEEDGDPALWFDGNGMFIKLPMEAIPRRSGFRIRFEVKPEGRINYMLISNRIHTRQKGLLVFVENGMLHGSFRSDGLEVVNFPTGLVVPQGEWSKIEVVYDYKHLIFKVNGQENRFPLSKPAFNNGYTFIGDGWGKVGSYQGFLRNLAISHSLSDND